MAKDPIRGMMVDEATLLRAKRDGQTFYFCGQGCPHRLLGRIQPTSAVAETMEHDGHFRQGNGGQACCGSKSTLHEHSHAPQQEPNRGAVKPSATAKDFYPMSPGVDWDQPGDCHSAAWHWRRIRHGIHRRRAKPSTPADAPGDRAGHETIE